MKATKLTLMLLFIVTLSRAQIVFTYDYLAKKFIASQGQNYTDSAKSVAALNKDSQVYLKKDDVVQIKIINLNRVLYKIETTKSEVDFNIALPSAFKSIKLPPYIITGSIAHSPSSADSLKSLQGVREYVSRIYLNFKTYNEKLERIPKFENALYAISRNCREDYPAIESQLIDITKSFVNNIRYIPVSERSPKEVGKGLKKYLDDLQNNIAMDASALKLAIPEYIRFLNESHNESVLELEQDIETLTDQLNSTPQKNHLLRNEIINNINTTKHTLALEKDSLSIKIKEISRLNEISDAATELLTQYEKSNKFYFLHRTYLLLANKSNFQYQSDRISVDKDLTTVKISIAPNDLNECESPEKKEIKVKIKAKSGAKVDFSSGAFWSSGLGNRNFLDPNYYYIYHTADTREIIRSNRKPYEGMLSIGGLAHLYFRGKGKFKGGFNAGMSTTAGFDNLNFHLGGSLFRFINDSDRLILNLGITLKSTKLLDRGLMPEKTYTKLESPDAIPLISEFPKLGFFASISYNLSRLKGE